MRYLRVALLLLHLTASLLQAPAGSARASASIGAPVAVGALLQTPSPTGPESALALGRALAAAPSPAHPDEREPLLAGLPRAGLEAIVASRISRYSPQSVPCDPLPLSERRPYDATAPPASA